MCFEPSVSKFALHGGSWNDINVKHSRLFLMSAAPGPRFQCKFKTDNEVAICLKIFKWCCTALCSHSVVDIFKVWLICKFFVSSQDTIAVAQLLEISWSLLVASRIFVLGLVLTAISRYLVQQTKSNSFDQKTHFLQLPLCGFSRVFFFIFSKNCTLMLVTFF